MNSAQQTPISKSQARLIKIAGVTSNDDYASAKQALIEAGLFGDAIPVGGTWRTAAKLNDADLLAACKRSAETKESADYGY